MKRLTAICGVVLAWSLLALAESPADKTGTVTEPARKSTGFSLNALDRSVDPCVNFYQFACGNWLKNNPIPADQYVWGRFSELLENNQLVERDILEKAAQPNPNRSAVDQKIGDYYASCMDVDTINKKGLAPLKPLLDRIDQVKDKSELATLLGKLHAEGVNVFFVFGPEQDLKDSNMVIASADQGGVGLPEREYYFRTDDKSQQTRKEYVAHVASMLKLAGTPADQAAKDAEAVMAFETALAKVSLKREERRDPQKLDNPRTRLQLDSMTPGFDWSKYLVAREAQPFQRLNVDVPGFLEGMVPLIQSTSLNDIKAYLRWQTLHSASPMLPEAFVNEEFDFYGKKLRGAKELRPRWKRCVQYTDNQLGEALGQAYVKVAFPPDAKARMEKMVQALEASLAKDIDGLDWMTADTKKAALAKLKKISDKIGYPDKWRDYSKYSVVRGDALGNSVRGDQFEDARQLAKIGKPVDKAEWEMTPPTVNAYYHPQQNNINFPAGILQPPFFDNKLDDAVNFGGIGAVIGHELTHGFDDEGRQFDGDGNLKPWWTEADGKAFTERAKCIVDEYSSFTAVDDVKLNGNLTLGENIADNGGIRIALMALLATMDGQPAAPIDGFTPEQRLFLGYGQVWCENLTPQALRVQAQSNEHSPPEFRVNGVVQNMPEFRKAFNCKAGQPMVRENACRVW